MIMKKPINVTLLSLLIFPGIGHLFLKKYALAIAFICSFGYLLMSLVVEIHDKTQELANSIIRGDIPLNIEQISKAIIESDVLNNPTISSMSYILMLIWVLAAFDAYRIAKKAK